MIVERPILFSAPMVRAILAGTKTQTRRVVKPPRGYPQYSYCDPFAMPPAVWWWNGEHERVGVRQECPYGVAGDLLWVRETWAKAPTLNPLEYHYRADRPDYELEQEREARRLAPKLSKQYSEWRWRPSIHMPRRASRITLRVTSVRVERLQEIGEDDAKAEGVRYTDFGEYTPRGTASLDGGRTHHPFKPRHHAGYHVADVAGSDECHDNARHAFGALWDSINAERAPWASNPWVWVIEFERAT